MLNELALVFGISMVPVAELRAAIPFGIASDLPPWLVWAVSVVGNMVPVPFIILFIRRIFAWMKTKEGILSRIVNVMEEKAAKGARTFYKYEVFGLFLLVAVPLPGTGAWTGALVAAMLNLRLKNSVPTIFLGVAAAGLIVVALTTGVLAIV